MDMGELTSRQIGELMAGGMLKAEEQLAHMSQNQLADGGRMAAQHLIDAQKGTVPQTIKNQNLGYNVKRAALGPNGKR